MATQASTFPGPEPRPAAAMSFLAHLEELRRRLIYSAIAVAAAFGLCWMYCDRIYALMAYPITFALAKHGLPQELIYTNPTEPFNIYLKIALLAGIFAASPFLLYQVWMFISPALYRHEKRYVLPFLVSTVALFLAGGFFAYRIVYPQALEFLIGYSAQFKPMITVSEYTDLFLAIMLGLGLVFELPVLAFFLSYMGMVSARWLWKNLRYSILIIFGIAAIVTPTTDIMNMCIFAAPMVALYLVSIGIAALFHPSRRRNLSKTV